MTSLPDSAPLAGDAAALRARAEEDGCLLLRGVPGPEAVAPLRELVLANVDALGLSAPGTALDGNGYDDPRWLELQQRVVPDPAFLRIGDHPALLAVLEALLDEPPLTRRGDVCRIALPGALHQTTPPHQDHYYTGGTTRIWTCWIALVPTPLELGPIAVLPGSHRCGFRPHHAKGVDLPDGIEWAAMPLAPGDAVLFNALTVHRALPNTTADRIRLSVDYRYQPSSEPIHVRRLDGSQAGPPADAVAAPFG
jgi:ectoine hydroxylase-related dioxygenase (phytanoyl-CoA dioxygenase family)